jgi:hypothetical protein
MGPAHRDERNRNPITAAKRAKAGVRICSAFRSGEGIYHQNGLREQIHGKKYEYLTAIHLKAVNEKNTNSKVESY